MCARPRTSRWINPALSKTLMCFEAAASEMAKGCSELADGPLAGCEFEKHAPARCVAQRVEDGAQLGRLNSTMWLNVSQRFQNVNRLVE